MSRISRKDSKNVYEVIKRNVTTTAAGNLEMAEDSCRAHSCAETSQLFTFLFTFSSLQNVICLRVGGAQAWSSVLS